jgi:3-deoxy-D-arabino-heptulosonate 7-phosphate (DAHP) synthase
MVEGLAKAAVAVGADGLMIEVTMTLRMLGVTVHKA